MGSCVLAVMAAAGCDVGSPSITASSRGFDAPPLQLGVVEATVGYTSDDRPIYARPNADNVIENVALSASVKLYFDRFLLPQKAIRQAICLRPSTDPVDSIADCRAPSQAFTEPEYNPVLRQLTYRLPSGTRLAPNTLYRLTVFVAPTTEDAGFMAFDGAPLAHRYTVDFRTADANAKQVDEPLPTPERYCAAVNCFAACDAADTACRQACRPLCVEPSCANDGALHRDGALFSSCAFGGCHAPGIGSDGAASDNSVIATNLDLRDGAAIAATAIGQIAHQTQQGENSQLAALSPLRFGRAMPIIDPQNPGNSYLLYKVIVNSNHFVNAVGDNPIDPALVADIERLRNSFVVGLPMPAEAGVIPSALVTTVADDGRTQVDAAASERALLLINTWISHGAVQRCPAP